MRPTGWMLMRVPLRGRWSLRACLVIEPPAERNHRVARGRIGGRWIAASERAHGRADRQPSHQENVCGQGELQVRCSPMW